MLGGASNIEFYKSLNKDELPEKGKIYSVSHLQHLKATVLRELTACSLGVISIDVLGM